MIDKVLQTIVKEILIRDIPSRDSDERLTIQVWWKTNPVLVQKASYFTFKEFARGFLKGDYPKTESIRRVRQKLQELYPTLRGHKYAARHKIIPKVILEIGDIK